MAASDDDPFYSLEVLLAESGLDNLPQQSDTIEEVEEPEIQLGIFSSRRKGDLTIKEKNHIVHELLQNLSSNKLQRGFQAKLAAAVGVHRSTISRIFKDINTQKRSGEVIDVRSKKLGKCGRKAKEYDEAFLQRAPLHLRTTIRAFAGALKVPHCVVQRLLKKGKLRSHSSNNHPSVTDNHKLARMTWVLKHVEPGTAEQPAQFNEMKNVIHIDEKWFYLNPEKRRFILLPKEENPYRCQQSKRYKIKVMFIAVIGRQIYDENGNMLHDGKFGIWPFVEYEAAKKTSKNRVRGTIETKAVQNVTQVVIRRMLIDKIIPTIKAQWPEGVSKEIYIQQDNARPHITGMDDEFMRAANANGFKIQLVFQPPQSPDLNVLDLGLFSGFQSIQYHSFPQNIDELIERVEEAYAFYDTHLIKYCWLSLQLCMIEILKDKGGNNYKLPHIGKARLDRLGILPENIKFDQKIVDEAVAYLNERFVPYYEGGIEEAAEVDED